MEDNRMIIPLNPSPKNKKVWIACDKDGSLRIFIQKPTRKSDHFGIFFTKREYWVGKYIGRVPDFWSISLSWYDEPREYYLYCQEDTERWTKQMEKQHKITRELDFSALCAKSEVRACENWAERLLHRISCLDRKISELLKNVDNKGVK